MPANAWALKQKEVDLELDLCTHLVKWDPWSAPDEGLTSAMNALAAEGVSCHSASSRCRLRTSVVERLACEPVEMERMPPRMQYHADARWRLQRGWTAPH